MLLALLLFNWIGFRLFVNVLQHRADLHLEAKIDLEQYDESQLVELRVPLNMPYQNEQPEFERIEGEIELDGQPYKYVKRKVEKGELVLMCLPNKAKQKLQDAGNDFFKMVNDLQPDSKGKKSESGSSLNFKNIFSEYQPENNDWSVCMDQIRIVEYSAGRSFLPSSLAADTPAQPPEQC